METPNLSVKSININDFKTILSRYDDTIKNLNKPAKSGSLSLEELDLYRFVEAPSRFSTKTGAKCIELIDLQKLMDWKIRHGTFRPTLPALIRKNSEETVKTTTTDAFSLYSKSPTDVLPVLKKIAELKGVGPATASLILAVRDPENIIFFSDEAFAWLVLDDDMSKKAKMKYDLNEYKALYEKSRDLMAKLKVSPIDIEKVAYVISKEAKVESAVKAPTRPTGNPRGRPKIPENEKVTKNSPVPGRGRGRPPGTKNTTSNKPVPGASLQRTESKSGRAIKPISTMYDEVKNEPPKRVRLQKRKASELEKTAAAAIHAADFPEDNYANKKAKTEASPPPSGTDQGIVDDLSGLS